MFVFVSQYPVPNTRGDRLHPSDRLTAGYADDTSRHNSIFLEELSSRLGINGWPE